MFQGLVDELVTALRGAFAAEFADVNDRVVPGPAPPQAAAELPRIVVTADGGSFSTRGKDESSSQPRPEEIRETITVDAVTPEGPYALARTPLDGSMTCRAVFDPGGLGERGVNLQEGPDFTLDLAAPSITFTEMEADEVRLRYSFVGVFAVREISQDVLVDAFAADAGAAERLASIAAAVTITSHDDLLEAVNTTTPTAYSAGDFASRHSVDRIGLVDVEVTEIMTFVRHRLRISAAGRLRASRALEDGFGLIERVHSPGVVSGFPVDVEPELG